MVNPNGKLPNGTVGSTMPEPPTTPTVQTVTGTNHHHNAAEMDPIKRVQERENLRNIIKQWNANRLDLFEISEPNEDLEFYGVMRFYFQDAGQKVATKCMRISSTASTADVIANLIEKFRPDIRMLSVPEYALYEIHENGEERKLDDLEMPLLVQLNWHKDDREGRFLLRRMDEKTYLPGFSHTKSGNILNRKLSKREKKEKKKREKREKASSKNDKNGKDSLAEKLYNELPETSFTRSISNPEAVMRRRRQQKLEKKLQQFSQEGGPDAGGTLRIFGESINQDVPYKTILLSTRDTASFAVKEILEKYGKDKEDPLQYCLVQMVVPYVNGNGSLSESNSIPPVSVDNSGPPIREYILDDDDCPLIIERSHMKTRGVLTFHIRRRPPDYQPRKRKKKMLNGTMGIDTSSLNDEASINTTTTASTTAPPTNNGQKLLPYIVEVNPDGSEIQQRSPGQQQQGQSISPKRHYLYMKVTEIGCEPTTTTPSTPTNVPTTCNTIQLNGPNILARHCVIAHTEGMITITPCGRDSETYVNGLRINETTILKHGMLVRFGKQATFKFVDEMALRRHSQLSTGAIMGQHFQQQAQLQQQQQQQQQQEMTSNASNETTFELDGTIKQNPPPPPSINNNEQQQQRTNNNNNHQPTQSHQQQQQPIRKGGDNILPAILEVWEDIEDHFLNATIVRLDPNQVQFKLCITYTLYMVTRYRASTYFKPQISPNQRATLLITFCIKYSNLIQRTITEHMNDQPLLAFWLANSSELLHFLKNDRHLSAFTVDAQEILADAIQYSFSGLVASQQHDLRVALQTFPDDMINCGSTEQSATINSTNRVLSVLSNSMQLLRRFRVNAALTIQLFSQLFHYINMWLFNQVIGTAESNLCTRQFGIRLKCCLAQIELWAEKQGLELAAECHLSRIVQTAQFLSSPKSTADELNQLVANFYKLNSLQLQTLFERYRPQSDEIRYQPDQIENVIKLARNTTDELILKEGREIRLEEETDLQLPFLLPEDGYSCDIVCGIPAGLQEFVQTLVAARVCSLTIQPTASGYWTIYFINFQPDQNQPNQTVTSTGNENEAESKDHTELTTKVNNQLISGPVQQQPQQITQQPQQQQQQQQQFLPPNNGGRNISAASMMAPQRSAMLNASLQMLPGYPFNGNGPQIQSLVRPMPEPEVQILKLQKSNNGIGLSIVAAQGNNQIQQGIYIKSVVKGGAADLDGRLEAGDQLLKVDGNSLIGIDQAKAAELMTQTGPIVTLEVAKQGAIFHGLGGMLNQQSTATLMKQAAIRPRGFVPNAQPNEQYGAIRMNGAVPPSTIHMQQLPRMPASPGGAPFPPYNTLPMSSLSYQQLASSANNRNTLPHSISHHSNPHLIARPDSQLSYNSQSKPIYEERHYQNIQLYQLNNQRTASPIGSVHAASSATSIQPPPPPSQTAPSQQQMAMGRQILHGSHSSLQPTPSSTTSLNAHHPHANHHQLSSQHNNLHNQTIVPASPLSRPISALVTSREQEQIFTSTVAYTSPGSASSTPRINSMIHSASSNVGPEFFHYPVPGSTNYGRSMITDPRQRDLMRQEAKMEEIRDELRRRDERLHQSSPYLPQSNVTMPRHGAGGTISMIGQPNSLRTNQRFVSQPILANGSTMNIRHSNAPPSSSSSGLRSNQPPPPAPKPLRPPTQQQQSSTQPITQVSYRYGPSGYPPPSVNNQQQMLERDFQRRVEEHNSDDDGEDDDDAHEQMLERAEHRERMLNMQQDIERTRQRRLEQRYGTDVGNGPDGRTLNRQLEEQEQRLKILKLEEDQLLMKAKRRQEDHRVGVSDTGVPPPPPNSSPPIESANQRLDRLLLSTVTKPDDDIPIISTTAGPIRGGVLKNTNGYGHPNNNTGESIDRSVKKVSWDDNPTTVVPTNDDDDDNNSDADEDEEEDDDNEAERGGYDVTPTTIRGNGDGNNGIASNGSNFDGSNSMAMHHQEDTFSLQDIDDVLGTQANSQKDWLSNYVSGNTPGVIGAQEVYNDPRKRIEAERLKSNLNQPPDKVPEKLSFAEKMKMFAKSTDNVK